jgi:hypothetical protein
MAVRWALFALSLALLLAGGCEKQRRPRDGAPVPLRDGETCGYRGSSSTVASNIFSGTTSGSSFYAGSCRSSSSAPEALYEWIAPGSGTFVIDTAGSDFDTVLYILAGSCRGAEIACDDDGAGSLDSRVTVSASGGQSFAIVVDGYNSASGAYTVNISVGGT